jgi:hypothetical protein
VGLSNAERQARWRERQTARAEKVGDYQILISRIEQLQAEVKRRSERAKTLLAINAWWVGLNTS